MTDEQIGANQSLEQSLKQHATIASQRLEKEWNAIVLSWIKKHQEKLKKNPELIYELWDELPAQALATPLMQSMILGYLRGSSDILEEDV